METDDDDSGRKVGEGNLRVILADETAQEMRRRCNIENNNLVPIAMNSFVCSVCLRGSFVRGLVLTSEAEDSVRDSSDGRKEGCLKQEMRPN